MSERSCYCGKCHACQRGAWSHDPARDARNARREAEMRWRHKAEAIFRERVRAARELQDERFGKVEDLEREMHGKV